MPNKSRQRVPDEKLHLFITRGRHEAYIELKKRYHRHSLVLVNDLLTQYLNTGVSKKELTSVCESHFNNIVKIYITGVSSFYGFWKEIATQKMMDYLIDNSYSGEASIFSGTISLNQDRGNNHPFEDVLAEKETSRNIKRQAFEIKAIMIKKDAFFSTNEKAVLNLMLNGFTFKDIEKSGLYGKTYVYLTFKSAVEKLQKYSLEATKNKKKY